MPMVNSLNVSELLKRLGVVGDSQGSASLLDALRMTVQIADLTDLVPPLRSPMAAVDDGTFSGVGTSNGWTLQCNSPGGLTVMKMAVDAGTGWRIWITDVDPFVGSVIVPRKVELVFGQATLSEFFDHAAAAAVAPANSLRVNPTAANSTNHLWSPGNWVGPGQFFNIESTRTNISNEFMSISWREYPGAINP